MRLARTFVLAFLSVLAIELSSTPFALAQVPDPVVAAEAPRPGAGHHYIGIGAETVNPADGSLSFDLPLQPPAGRQISFTFGIRFAGTEQYFLKNWSSNGNLYWWPNGAYGSPGLQIGAWSYDEPLLAATTSIFWSASIPYNGCPNGVCAYSMNYCFGNDSYVFRGLDGNQYSLALGSVFPDPNNKQQGYCPAPPNNVKGPSNQHGVLAAYQSSSSTIVVDPSGNTYEFPTGSGQPQEPNVSTGDPIMWGVAPTSITDRNGNQISGYKDSTGRSAISVSGIGSSNGDQINIAGLSSPVVVKWTTTPVSFPETGSNMDASPNTCTLSGAVPGSSPIQVVSEIDLPNGQKYTFQYDGTYGKVSKITFPDGGYVRYIWGLFRSAKGTHASWSQSGNPMNCDFVFDAPAVTDRYVSYDGSTEVLHQQFSYALPNWSPGGGAGPVWTTKQTTVTSTDLLTSQITKTIYTYSPATPDNNVWVTSSLYSRLVPVETKVLYKDGSGKTYKEVNKDWLNPHIMMDEQTILYDSSGHRSVGSAKVYGYDANEQSTGVGEYGFQTEGPPPSGCGGNWNCSYVGPLRRSTTNVYHPYFSWNGGSTPPTWTGIHIVNAPDSVTVTDGSGTTLKKTLFTYDENVLQASNAINLTNTGATRANATTVQRLISGTTYAKTTYTYFDTGQVASMTDACGNTSCADMTGTNHTTTYSYSDNYASGTGTPPGQTFAYVTQVTHPPTANANHTERFTWGYNDGLIRSHTDVENSLTASYAYADPFLRLTQTVAPDGGQTNISYNDTAPSPTVTTSKQINGSQTLSTVSVRDGMGHVKQTQLASDPQGTVYTDTTFNGLGQVWKQSNPYRVGNDITTTTGTTVFSYDAIGRNLTTTYPDNSVLTTAYCGPSTLVTDPTQRWRRSRTDGLGFLVEVDEPNATGASVNSNGCPGTGEPIWVTSYTLDTLGNLKTVVQNGSHQRTFSYDSLSRLLTSSNPEVGQITYVYDANSNVYTKTDARNLTTTYGYDDLNRPLSRSYSNSDPSVSITYDQSNCLNLSACQNVGQRTSMTDAAGSESWAYQVDSAHSRSVHEEKRTTNSITKPSTYYFDLAGNVTQAVYPTGRVVNYTFDNAVRPSTATDGSNGITYATGFQTSPGGTCAANVTCYTPQGTFYALSIGQTSSFTGLNLTHIYNTRLQPQEFKASSSGGNAIDISYNFVDPSTNKNAGIVYGISNNLDSTRSQTFSYDQLNRITGALTTSTHATSPSHCWGETYTLDAWANLNSIAATSNSNYNGCSQESGFSTTADGNNHLPVWGYDASGNATSDGFVTNYQWDAESQLNSAAGVTYTYDGDGRRVAKVGSKLYWYGSGGDILAETDTSGNTTAEYIFFGGKRVTELGMGTQGSPGTGSATISGSEQSITGAPTSGTGSVTFSGTLQSKQVQTQAAASGTGSVTLNGTLQSKQVVSQAATSGAGSVTLSGTVQSKQVQTQAAKPGTASVTIYGSERDDTFDPCAQGGHGSCPQQIPDTGYVHITVNGFTASYTYGYADTAATVAAGLASALTGGSSPVTASASNGVVYLTSIATGSSTNYSLSSTCSTTQTSFYSGCPSFSGSPSGSTLTGGANAVYSTVYDSGTTTIAVNGHADTASWSGSGTTSSSIASSLASNINADSGASVTASASGSTVNLTAKTTGASTNYSLSSSGTFDSTDFSSSSFSTSNSGSTLTGGKDPVYNTIYDSGTSTITVNGHADIVSWSGSGTTTSSIASALASQINADSGASATASASGSTVNLTAKTAGASTNYALSTSNTYDSTDFSSSSFTTSNSGSALTGGRDASYTTVYDSGASTITVNGHPDSTSWSGSGTTTSSIASSLASTINSDSGASVSASASGSTVNLTAKTTGANTNYSLSSSSTYDSTNFSSASFTSSNSGSTLAGGQNAGTTYDSGTAWITINNTQYSVSYGQGSSSSSVATALTSAINAGSLANASASGSGISLTAKTTGAATNYSLSSGSSTSQPGKFSSSSFSVSVSGSALTGGKDATQNIVNYYVEDMLGTSRVLTTSTGVVCYDADFYPYGGERSYANTCPQNYKFEGKERDTETGNDDFGARYYSNRFGRWLSADWSAVPAPVPYANLTNPQTLNLYSMVADDPESFADLDGHCIEDACVLEGVAIGTVLRWAVGALVTYATAAVVGETVSRSKPSDGPSISLPQPIARTPLQAAWDLAKQLEAEHEKTGAKPAQTAQGDQSTPAQPPDGANGQGLPKPPSGRGSVPPEQRDPKRVWTKAENQKKLDQQNGKCAQCGKDVPPGQGRGHHIERHADGTRTVDKYHAVVCDPCHKKLHKPNQSPSDE